MTKKLVAYFSASGTTRKIAEQVAAAAGADLHEIEPAVPYTSADLNWMDKKSRSTIEMNNKSFRPELAASDADLDLTEYDTIILGFPIWWYVAPTIINTFLEAHGFAGKRVVLFATSGGSGFGATVRGLQPSAPNATIVEGRLLNGASPKAIADWVATL